jgi:epoxyqueuosine reductase
MFAGSPIKRIGIARMIRNCLVAAGNSGDEALVDPVRRHLADEDPTITEAARWALDQLRRSSSEMQVA